MTAINATWLGLLVFGSVLGCDGSPLYGVSHTRTTTNTNTNINATTTTTTTAIQVLPGEACPTGFTPCGKAGGLRCIDLSRSAEHCGQCGNACAPGISCQASQCQQYQCKGGLSFRALPVVPTTQLDQRELHVEEWVIFQSTLGDFNRDGILDFVGMPNTQAPMGLLIGKGDGTFQARPLATAFSHEWKTAAADLNHDGWLDLVSIDLNQSTVAVRLGNGDPNSIFAVATDYATDLPPNNLLLADLDSDGNTDLVVGVGSRLTRWRGGADGKFTPIEDIPLSTKATLLAAVDYNGDTVLDLLYGSSTLRMVLGDGYGGFGTELACGLALSDYAPTAFTDLNHDGKIDMVQHWTGIMLGMNGCNFDSLTPFPGGKFITISGVEIVDLNGDGHGDILTRKPGYDQISVLHGSGKGTFDKAQHFPGVGFQPGGFHLVGDLNGDTKLDIIVTDIEGWRVLLNTCP